MRLAALSAEKVDEGQVALGLGDDRSARLRAVVWQNRHATSLRPAPHTALTHGSRAH